MGQTFYTSVGEFYFEIGNPVNMYLLLIQPNQSYKLNFLIGLSYDTVLYIYPELTQTFYTPETDNIMYTCICNIKQLKTIWKPYSKIHTVKMLMFA